MSALVREFHEQPTLPTHQPILAPVGVLCVQDHRDAPAHGDRLRELPGSFPLPDELVLYLARCGWPGQRRSASSGRAQPLSSRASGSLKGSTGCGKFACARSTFSFVTTWTGAATLAGTDFPRIAARQASTPSWPMM